MKKELLGGSKKGKEWLVENRLNYSIISNKKMGLTWIQRIQIHGYSQLTTRMGVIAVLRCQQRLSLFR